MKTWVFMPHLSDGSITERRAVWNASEQIKVKDGVGWTLNQGAIMEHY